MGRPRKPAQTEEQKIAALENRVETLNGAVQALQGQVKDLTAIIRENLILRERISMLEGAVIKAHRVNGAWNQQNIALRNALKAVL